MMIRKLTVLAMVAALALGAFGCKKDKDGDGGKGGKGGGDLAAKLQGEWSPDVAKMAAADPKMAKLGEAEKKMISEMLAKMVIKVGKDTIEMVDPEGKKEKDTYTVKSSSGKSLTIESKDEKGKLETITAEFTSDNDIVLSKAGDKEKMYLKRK